MDADRDWWKKKRRIWVVCGLQGVWTHHRPMLQHERKKMDCEEDVEKIFNAKTIRRLSIFFGGGRYNREGYLWYRLNILVVVPP